MVDRTSASAPSTGTTTRRLLVAVGVALAVLPILVATQRARDQGWQPVLDDSNISARAAAFAAGHPPLVGAPSTSLEVVTGIRPVNHLGPAEYYLLGAGQVVASGPTMLLLSALAISAAAAAVTVIAAARLGGPWAGLAVGALAGLVAARLGTPIVADIWNPYLPILPLAAALMSLWAAVLTRWSVGWPLAVLFGTLAAQSHLTHGPLLVAAAVPVVVVWWRSRRTATGDDDGQEHPARRVGGLGRVGLPAAACAVIIVVFWLPPVLSELTSHSNVLNLWRALTKDTGQDPLGLGYALKVFAEVVAVPPPWGPPATAAHAWFLSSSFSFAAAAVALTSMLPLVLLVVAGWRRDRTAVVVAASCLAADVMAIALLSTSTFTSGVALYQTRWLWTISLLHWGGISIAGVRLAALWPQRRPVSWAAAAALAVVVAAGAVAVVAPPSTARSITPDHRVRIDTVSELLPGTMAAGRREPAPLVIHLDSFGPVAAATVDLIGNLAVRDRSVRVESGDRPTREQFGTSYAASPGQRGTRLVVTARRDARRMIDSGFTEVAAVRPLSPQDRQALARAEQDLRARHSRGEFRLTGLFAKDDPRAEAQTLFDENMVEEAAFTGQVAGRVPPKALLRTFTDLKRRDDNASSAVVVWRSPR